MALATAPGLSDDHAYTVFVAPIDECKTVAKRILPQLNALYLRYNNRILVNEQEKEGVPEDERTQTDNETLLIRLSGLTDAYLRHYDYRHDRWPDTWWKETHVKGMNDSLELEETKPDPGPEEEVPAPEEAESSREEVPNSGYAEPCVMSEEEEEPVEEKQEEAAEPVAPRRRSQRIKNQSNE